jgi:hypothetical protein
MRNNHVAVEESNEPEESSNQAAGKNAANSFYRSPIITKPSGAKKS